jgi:antitoxin (DNA-binding transcriptional repressor) of toxin-antitoxin stability system
MREPQSDRTYATPASTAIPALIEAAKAGQIVPLSEDGEPVAAVVPIEVARAGLAALGRPTEIV